MRRGRSQIGEPPSTKTPGAAAAPAPTTNPRRRAPPRRTGNPLPGLAVRPGPRKCPTPTKAAHPPAPNRGAWRATTQPTRRPARPRECRPSAADAVGMPVDGDPGPDHRRCRGSPSGITPQAACAEVGGCAPHLRRVGSQPGAWTPSLHGRGTSRDDGSGTAPASRHDHHRRVPTMRRTR